MLCILTVHLNLGLFIFRQMVMAGEVNKCVFAWGCLIFMSFLLIVERPEDADEALARGNDSVGIG